MTGVLVEIAVPEPIVNLIVVDDDNEESSHYRYLYYMGECWLFHTSLSDTLDSLPVHIISLFYFTLFSKLSDKISFDSPLSPLLSNKISYHIDFSFQICYLTTGFLFQILKFSTFCFEFLFRSTTIFNAICY